MKQFYIEENCLVVKVLTLIQRENNLESHVERMSYHSDSISNTLICTAIFSDYVSKVSELFSLYTRKCF